MASLVLLLSELLRHQEPNFAFDGQPSSSPPSCIASISSVVAMKTLINKVESAEIVEDVPQELSVRVHDLVWP
ncbi:hypothetical protein CCACVL1_05234 [Corchorus capsularis]|uniref:Uncharacterized protein n=1 Tax=Corchorus capsularis TaxID=210143 RepID=A0A1R3JLS3_COCAP|nr:hypothetical protein CCACVL1_05234 [Corchorus capsularis]